ncbi:MAG: Ureidoglycolate lyase [Icmadophila ericetorum]|nr:Ureidoglycolate lyase [Icmadophila ericetorum]
MTGQPARSRIINVRPLSKAAFAPFGHVIENPSGQTDEDISSTIPASANQGTALVYSNISPVTTKYSESSNNASSGVVMSLFSCSPRQVKSATDLENLSHSETVTGFLDLSVLERHPYTTQTFIPLGLDRDSSSVAYLVVVAPTILGPSKEAGLPDFSSVQAFLGRGSQAVTYGVGTWHAPMIVIGDSHINFVVVQYKNHIPQDDCEELEFVSSDESGIQIAMPHINK